MMQQFIYLINDALNQARTITTEYYRKPSINNKNHKDDGTLVTKADIAIEKAINSVILTEYPDHHIIGEECGYSENLSARHCWVVDPIDGTISFVAGRPTFVTLLGLMDRGRPILGAIDQAITCERWIGSSAGTFLNGESCTTSTKTELAQALIATSAHHYFCEDLSILDKLIAKCDAFISGGDGYLFGLLALGKIDIIIERGVSLHDFCALIPVIEGAGGVITDWQGKNLIAGSDSLKYGRKFNILATANHLLHDNVLKIISQRERNRT